MSFAVILLRLLLCFGLLVNGVAAQAIAAKHSVLANHQSSVATTPCHETGDMQVMAPQFHEHRAGPATNKPDCCKSGACDCACSHGAVASMPALHGHGRKVKHATFVSLPTARYASPVLPRLIRPPIV